MIIIDLHYSFVLINCSTELEFLKIRFDRITKNDIFLNSQNHYQYFVLMTQVKYEITHKNISSNNMKFCKYAFTCVNI